MILPFYLQDCYRWYVQNSIHDHKSLIMITGSIMCYKMYLFSMLSITHMNSFDCPVHLYSVCKMWGRLKVWTSKRIQCWQYYDVLAMEWSVIIWIIIWWLIKNIYYTAVNPMQEDNMKSSSNNYIFMYKL